MNGCDLENFQAVGQPPSEASCQPSAANIPCSRYHRSVAWPNFDFWWRRSVSHSRSLKLSFQKSTAFFQSSGCGAASRRSSDVTAFWVLPLSHTSHARWSSSRSYASAIAGSREYTQPGWERYLRWKP